MIILRWFERLTHYSSEFFSHFGKVLGCMRLSGFFTEFVGNCVNKAFTQL